MECDYEFVALRHPEEYAMNEGRPVSNKGMDIPVSEYEDFFQEEHLRHSTSLHSRIVKRGAYLVGPLARFNLNFDQLSPAAKDAAESAGFKPVCKNTFKSIIARAVELVFACEEALRIIGQYEPPRQSKVKALHHSAKAYGCTEAPRGILYHRYTVGDYGLIRDARLVPPTSQNQKTIERDLADFAQRNINMPKDKLTWHCEQVVRNYDPCISCSCHFLKLNIERE